MTDQSSQIDLEVSTPAATYSQPFSPPSPIAWTKPLPLTRSFSKISSDQALLSQDIRHPKPQTISEAFAQVQSNKENITQTQIECPRCKLEFDVTCISDEDASD
jgi:hypothetical protein